MRKFTLIVMKTRETFFTEAKNHREALEHLELARPGLMDTAGEIVVDGGRHFLTFDDKWMGCASWPKFHI